MGNFCCDYSRDWEWLSDYQYKYEPQEKEIWLGAFSFKQLIRKLLCFCDGSVHLSAVILY